MQENEEVSKVEIESQEESNFEDITETESQEESKVEDMTETELQEESTIKENMENESNQSEIKEEELENSEYIFPNSDGEYLLDSEVMNLSKETLALGRNEIIARHGRIFTNEKYKEYFESKSWYEGTIAPEEFDNNYDNLLNETEKKNIELIQYYESQETSKAAVDKYWSDFLDYYQRAQSTGFSGSPEEYELINPIYATYGFSGELYYAFVDLANDGVPELFIKNEYEITDAYIMYE